MNLAVPLGKLQKIGGKVYLQFAQRFNENNLIRDTWVEMARDLDHQTASMREIKPKFWKELKKEEKALLAATKEIFATADRSLKDRPTDGVLHHAFANSLDFEELLTINVYAPLIYRLRSQWTNRALSFYVTVNAHITRLVRLVHQFSGDPALIQRSVSLLERFEKEAQGPKPEPPAKLKKRARGIKQVIRATGPARKKPGKSKLPIKIAARRSSALTKRSKRLVKRAKPIMKNIGRRRARSRA